MALRVDDIIFIFNCTILNVCCYIGCIVYVFIATVLAASLCISCSCCLFSLFPPSGYPVDLISILWSLRTFHFPVCHSDCLPLLCNLMSLNFSTVAFCNRCTHIILVCFCISISSMELASLMFR